ncbi:chorismate-binding protein [Propionibacteriaceae bacterium G1746]|uniref:chorismate-binding protein n=1 Tax=Aestuariimicrobium sp. G57 TaxID=3418485 RepID=UPI003C216635
MSSARFDDLRPGRRRSFRLTGLVDEFTARHVGDVHAVLAHAEAAVASGRWVAGWVSYEAAPAFDVGHVVRPVAGTPFAELPLAWFGVFERREPVDQPGGDAQPGKWTASIDEARHREDIEAIRARIARGDSYQVNHTFRLSAPFTGEPADLYGRLAHAQRGGFGALIEAGRWAVVSASPELFFDWAGDRVTCRPMKGTARRGFDADSDALARAGLLDSAKDRAENLMIVDMMRNDLARVAVTGTVAVEELFTAERYDTVWQLTSSVTARTRPGTTLGGVFDALFPCASITGAPRSSTMRIIAERETTPRGVYCGAIGFGGPSPTSGAARWVFNVGIRTVLVDRQTSTAWYGTGGGVTYDSTAAGEYAEALLKAEVLTRAPATFGLLETMRWQPGESGIGVVGWDAHLARLQDAARYFDIPLDAGRVRDAVLDAVAVGGPGPGSGPRRVRLVVDQQGVPEVTTAALPPAGSDAAPVRVVVDEVPVDSRDPFLRHKTTLRAVYEAAAARHPQVDDVVLVNERGEVTETTIASIAALIDGQWCTPTLDSGCLPGTTRARLVASGQWHERVLEPGDLAAAQALVRANAVRGCEPVELVLPSSGS